MSVVDSMSRAEKRAIELMERVLGPKETLRYLSTARVEVIGNWTGRRYVVGGFYTLAYERSRSWPDQPLRLCAQLSRPHWFWRMIFGTWPRADRVVTLAVWIRSNEREFLKIANRLREYY